MNHTHVLLHMFHLLGAWGTPHPRDAYLCDLCELIKVPHIVYAERINSQFRSFVAPTFD